MKWFAICALALACALPLSANTPAPPQTDGGGGLIANGDAHIDGGTFVLTENTAWQVGSVFIKRIFAPVFGVSFDFRLSPTEEPADGITFCIHNDPRGAKAVGAKGGHLGYAKADYWGVGGISNSIAVEFDNYYNPEFSDKDADHVGIDINANPVSETVALLPFELENTLIHARVVYDGAALSVYAWPDGSKPGGPLLTYKTDIPGLIRSGSTWIGFTGATGTCFQKQEVTGVKVGGK